MIERQIYVHTGHNNQEVRKVAAENLTTVEIAALAGADLVEGKFVHNVSTGHLNIYAGGAWHEIVRASDLNRFGALIQAAYDASAGIPAGSTNGGVGSGVDSLGVPLTGTASIQAGDYWLVTTAGTIVGILGDDNLSVGDFLWALQDNPTLPAHFAGVNMNVNDAASGAGTVRVVTKTAPLVANTPLSYAAEMTAAVGGAMTVAHSVQVIDVATGDTIGLAIDPVAKTIESNVAIASVTISVLGV
jgi:hypothetical protein